MADNASVCCICLLPEDDSMWACTVCSVKCHNTCVSSWVRTNYDRVHLTFSCPVCRQNNNLNTVPTVNLPRPTLSGFIASVLQSVRLSESSEHVPDASPDNTESTIHIDPLRYHPRRRRPPSVSVNGTGAIHIERLTVVNHF